MPINGITKVTRLGARGPSGAVLSEARLAALEGSPTFTGSITAVSGTFTGNVAAGDSASDTLTVYRLATAGNAPAFTVGAAMGSGPGAQTITGNDTSCTIIQDAGTSTTTGVMWTVVFATARAASTYRASVHSAGSNAADCRLYTTNKTVNGFDIACRVAPTASTQVACNFTVIQ